MNNWKNIYKRFDEHYGSSLREGRVKVEDDFFSKEELQSFRVLKDDIDDYLVECLTDERKRIFVKCLATMSGTVPKPLFEAFVKAGVYCKDPSFNKHYLSIPYKINARKAYKILMHYLKSGSDFEIAGAANAFYWFGGRLKEMGEDSVLDYRKTCLEKFIKSESLDTLRALIAKLNVKPENYPSEYVYLIEKALEKASVNEDSYIQNRYKILLGESNTFNPLPERGENG